MNSRVAHRLSQQQIQNVSHKLDLKKDFIQNHSGSFSQEVMALCRRKGYNKATFSEKTLLSEKTYDRIRNQETRGMPRPETVMQICIGLRLGIEYGEPLFRKAGYDMEGSELLIAYRTILIECRKIDICECNDILEALGLPLLARRMIRALE